MNIDISCYIRHRETVIEHRQSVRNEYHALPAGGHTFMFGSLFLMLFLHLAGVEADVDGYWIFARGQPLSRMVNEFEAENESETETE